MKRVDRYLWRELLPTFGVALLAFLVFIGLELVLSLSDTLFARGAGAGEMLRLLLYKLPSVLTLAIPAGVLLATFLALSRLASSRELLAFQALGYPLRRLLFPFVAFGLLASLVSLSLSEFAVPPSEAAYRHELLSVLYKGKIPSPQEHVFFRGSEGELYYVSNCQGNRAHGIVVYDLEGRLFPEEGPFPTLLTAEEGSFQGEKLVLGKGHLFRFTEDGGLEEVLQFDRLTLAVGQDVEQGLLSGKTPSEMSLRELASRINLLKEAGLDPRNLVVEFHSKLAIAAAAFIFALFGAPLGALLGRRGRAAGAVAGFVLAAGAQGLFIWTRTLARRGFLPASLGGWLPHLLLGLLGVFLLLSIDRLRLRGLWAALLVLVLSTTASAAPPPFSELRARELSIQSGANLIQGEGISAQVRGFKLTAKSLKATWDGKLWNAQAQEAELTGGGFSLLAKVLSAAIGPEGELVSAAAQDFSGSSRFRGPEKEETLLFSGKQAEAWFHEGELVRIEAKAARFSTCPCLEGAPYTIHADRLVLLPKRWLYAEGVLVEAFGHPAGWLPVYAARLGKEAIPLFPELGRSGGHWFLRWHVPFAMGEGAWGGVGLTWFPFAGRADPSLQLIWEGGSLSLAREEGNLTAVGDNWQASLSWKEDRLEALFKGILGKVNWSLAWGKAETEHHVYFRAPEFSLSCGGIPWLGGRLSLRLSGGRYIEEEAGWRAHASLSWARDWKLSRFHLSLPWQLSLDQYQGTQRLLASATPSLEAGGLTLAYLGRLRVGRSPFGFDQSPPESRLSLTFNSQAGGLRQALSMGWDLAQGSPLPGRWTLETEGFRLTGEFSLPAEVKHLSWTANLAGEDLSFALKGGLRLSPMRWEDLLVKGRAEGRGWKVSGGVRLSPWPPSLKRMAATFMVSLGQDWVLRMAGEYDFPARKFVQLQAGLLRTFSGCLRAGVEVYLGGVRLTLEVPAFPQAKASFAPLDEGLRLGG